VPIVLGFVALGGVVVATRAMLGFRHAFGSRDGRRRRSWGQRPKRPTAPLT
jgi:hypothetical protein